MNLNLKRACAVCFVLTLAAIPAMADKIWVDYDRSVDFSKFSTFTYMKSDLAMSNDLMDQRIVKAIVAKLTQSGLTQVDAGGDFVFTYQVTGETPARVEMSNVTPTIAVWGTSGIGYGTGWGGGWAYDQGGWTDTSVVSTNYKKGSLLIEAYDPSTKQAIWRGSAEQAVTDNPKKASKRFETSIDKIAEKWAQLHQEE